MIDYETLLALRDYKRYHSLFFFNPYPYQQKFYQAGKRFKQRYMRAGNRVGKSYGAAMEFAQHLTGLYRPWFEGEHIPDSGHTYWCLGIDLDAVSKVMQKELFGTVDCRLDKQMGTGAIPREHIVFDEGMIKDGPRLRSCQIRHVDGGFNTLIFYGSNNEAAMMGQSVKGVWMDEEDKHNSLSLYSQCVTRTATTDGFVIFTATPEAGYTELNRLFEEDKTGQLYLQSVGWDDCPHLTPEIRERLLAGIPEWQHQMRMNGLPVIGSGAVFPIADEAITEAPVKPGDDWLMVAGVDFGMVVDPSTIVYVAQDPEGVIHLLDEVYLDEDRSPRAIASAILGGSYPNVLTILPHDAGLNSDDPQAKGKLLIEYGVNVHRETFRNPTDVKLGIDELKPKPGAAYNSVEAGLIEMLRRLEEGTLKVSSTMENWLREKRGYFYKTKQTGGFSRVGADHVIDASRYAVMSLIGGLADSVFQSRNQQRNEDWSNYTTRLRGY